MTSVQFTLEEADSVVVWRTDEEKGSKLGGNEEAVVFQVVEEEEG